MFKYLSPHIRTYVHTWSYELHPDGLIKEVITVLQDIAGATRPIKLIRLIWQEAESLTYPIPSRGVTKSPAGSKNLDSSPMPSSSPCNVLPEIVLTEPKVGVYKADVKVLLSATCLILFSSVIQIDFSVALAIDVGRWNWLVDKVPSL